MDSVTVVPNPQPIPVAAALGARVQASVVRPSRPRLPLDLLDGLRGIAALYVLLGHAWGFLVAGSLDPTAAASPLVGALVYALRFGRAAVVLFFVLSGFCIHYRQALALAAAAEDGTQVPAFELRHYAWRRVRRLWPALLLALALTAALDAFGAHLAPDFYANTGGARPLPLAHEMVLASPPNYGAATVLGALLLQGGLTAATLGSNTPLWSLGYEGWYYAVYPLLLLVSRRYGATAMWRCALLGSLVGGVGEFLHLHWNFGVLTPWGAWAAGALVAEIAVGRHPAPRWLRWAPMIAVPLAGPLLLLPRMQSMATDLAWGMVFALLLAWALLLVPGLVPPALHWLRQPAGVACRALGAVSYSLYVTHYPVVVVLCAWWLTTHAAPPQGVGLLAAGLSLALGIAVTCWYVAERPFVAPRASRATSGQVRARRPAAPGSPATAASPS